MSKWSPELNLNMKLRTESEMRMLLRANAGAGLQGELDAKGETEDYFDVQPSKDVSLE